MKNACAVGDDFFAATGRIDCAGVDSGTFVDADIEFFNAVVERHIDDEVMHFAVEVFDVGLFAPFKAVGIGAVGVDVAPFAVVEDVEVGSVRAGGRHVEHVGVPKKAVTDTNSLRIGGESDADARRTLRTSPQVGAYGVFKIGRNAGVVA